MWLLPIRVTRPVYKVDKIVFIFHYLSITLMETDGFWEILTWLFYKVTKCSQIGLCIIAGGTRLHRHHFSWYNPLKRGAPIIMYA